MFIDPSTDLALFLKILICYTNHCYANEINVNRSEIRFENRRHNTLKAVLYLCTSNAHTVELNSRKHICGQ